MARLRDIVIDCRHPASLARFWAAALDGYQVASYDQPERARLAALGIDDPEDDPNVLVEPTDVTRPRLFLQLVPEPKLTKNRLHLDLLATRPQQELRRLTALGAQLRAEHEGFVVLADPEGNEFCLSLTAGESPAGE